MENSSFKGMRNNDKETIVENSCLEVVFPLLFQGDRGRWGGSQQGCCLPSLTFPSTLDIRDPSYALLLASTLQLLVQPPPIAEAQVITQYLVPYPSAQAQTSKRLRRWLSTCGDEPGAAQTCALGRSSHSFPSPLSWHPGTLGMLRNKTNLHNHIFSCWKMKKNQSSCYLQGSTFLSVGNQKTQIPYCSYRPTMNHVINGVFRVVASCWWSCITKVPGFHMAIPVVITTKLSTCKLSCRVSAVNKYLPAL